MWVKESYELLSTTGSTLSLPPPIRTNFIAQAGISAITHLLETELVEEEWWVGALQDMGLS